MSASWKENSFSRRSRFPATAGNRFRSRGLSRLVAAKDGEIVREGAAHEKEYIYNPNDYRFLYMDFATL